MSKSKRVLITGASGLLGRACFNEFKNDASWETLGLAFSRASEKLRKVDITKEEEVTKVVDDFKPSVIIHSAAERKPDVVESKPEETKQLNVTATEQICKAAKRVGAWVLYVSTDYVFDGKSPPYKEDAVPNPLNKYGVSKLDGEKVTLQVNPDNSVLRVPILYGQVEYIKESAVTILFEKVKDTKNKCEMSHYEKRYPTHCDDVAYVIRQMSDKQVQDGEIKGIYHWSGDNEMTKYDMAVTMATEFKIPTDHIIPVTTATGGATRPYDAHLSCEKIENLKIGKRTQFKDGIVGVLKPFL